MFTSNKIHFLPPFCFLLSLIALGLMAYGQAANSESGPGYAMTSGRFVATMAAVLGLIGVVIGVVALVRPASRFGTASGRLGVIIALATGLIGTSIGGLIVTTAGGFGTGGGRAGAIAAVVLGLIALALGGLALARSNRVQQGNQSE